jgi:hypothetical protein
MRDAVALSKRCNAGYVYVTDDHRRDQLTVGQAARVLAGGAPADLLSDGVHLSSRF